MSQPFVGEIRMFGGNFAPAGWMFCDGQLLPISENEVLFQLIGTTYGGDGQETFALPNLQSRIPLHMGTGSGLSTYQLAETGGLEEVTITAQTMPQHTHPALASDGTGSNVANPAAAIWSKGDLMNYATALPPSGFMGSAAITTTPAGGSQPHENMVPFLCVSFIISLFGIFPTQ